MVWATFQAVVLKVLSKLQISILIFCSIMQHHLESLIFFSMTMLPNTPPVQWHTMDQLNSKKAYQTKHKERDGSRLLRSTVQHNGNVALLLDGRCFLAYSHSRHDYCIQYFLLNCSPLQHLTFCTAALSNLCLLLSAHWLSTHPERLQRYYTVSTNRKENLLIWLWYFTSVCVVNVSGRV